MSRAHDDCQLAQELMAGQPVDAAQALWVAAHREGCPSCQQVQEDVAWLRRSVLQTPASLDDVSRARILARLGPTFDGATRPGRLLQTWRRRALVWGAVAALLLVIWVPTLLVLLRTSSEGNSGQASLGEGGLLPVAVEHGAQQWPELQSVLGRRVRELQLPRGVEVRATLGKRTTLALAGPGELAVTRSGRTARAEKNTLWLKRGRLLARFSGCPGCQLRVHVPGAVVEVVGTVFLLQVGSDESLQVAVRHGAVRVRWRGGTVLVPGGQSWSNSANARTVLTTEEQLMRRFEDRASEAGSPLALSSGEPDEPGMQSAAPGASAAEPAPPEARPAPKAEKTTEPAPAARPGATSEASRASTPGAPPAGARPEVRPMPPASRPARIAPASQPARPAVAAAAAPKPEIKVVATPPVAAGRQAARLYQRAELAMRTRDHGTACQVLEELVGRWGQDPLAAQARYELAHLLLQTGQSLRAVRHLEALLSSSSGNNLKEPAGYLLCRAVRAQGDASRAASCFLLFREQHPGSPHDAVALGTLLQIIRDCGQVTRLATEYLTRYPKGRMVGEARQQLQRCKGEKQ